MSNPSSQVYGGDVITSIVIDPGSYTTNIGYSGTDCPQVILPSNYGSYTNSQKQPEESADDNTEQLTSNTEDEQTDDYSPNKKKLKRWKRVFGEQSICIPRPDYEIKPVVENGIIVDWDAAQEQWTWALETQMYLSSNKGIPALLTEPIWNTVNNRKKSLEVLLEGLDFEACYLAANPTCVSFAAGRPNCLVVDIGHDTCGVSPVVDGMTLSKSSLRNFFAGKYLNELIRQYLNPREIIPLFAIEKRRPEFKKRVFEYSVDKSLYNFANDRGVFQEIKETLCQVSPTLPLKRRKTELEALAKRSIEMPWTEELVVDNMTRYSFGEQLFEVQKENIPENWDVSKDGTVMTWHNDYVPLKRNKPGVNSAKNGEDTPQLPNTEKSTASNPEEDTNENGKRTLQEGEEEKHEIYGITDLVYSSIMASDVDLRATFAHNIVLTGGTSLIPGLSDRLMYELNQRLPSLKFRILSSGHSRERLYQSWLGGSILTSLGTVHQLWVGKEEYAEVGPDRLLNDRFR